MKRGVQIKEQQRTLKHYLSNKEFEVDNNCCSVTQVHSTPNAVTHWGWI